MKAIKNLLSACQQMSPATQAYALVGICLVLQYSLNALAYFGLFPDIAGKSLNGAIKNLAYLLPGTLAIAGVIFFEGKNGLVRVIRPYFVIPMNPLWWLIAGAVLIPPLFLALHLNDLLYQKPFTVYQFSPPSGEEILHYSPRFAQVAISDELFWIGFIYPRLLSAGYSHLKSSLVIGTLWGMDYLPFLFTEFFLSPGLNAPNLIFGWLSHRPALHMAVSQNQKRNSYCIF